MTYTVDFLMGGAQASRERSKSIMMEAEELSCRSVELKERAVRCENEAREMALAAESLDPVAFADYNRRKMEQERLVGLSADFRVKPSFLRF